jgi:manganese oxidase
MYTKNVFIMLVAVLVIGTLLISYGFIKNNENEPFDYSSLQQTAQENIGATGEYQSDDFDPTEFLTTWNFNNLPQEKRAKVYRETRLRDGTMLREYTFIAQDEEIEVAPGVFFPAWTYNGQVPGPTIRATEGDTIKITFVNDGTKPHTAHFHGFHSADMDGSAFEDLVLPGETFEYEFKAEPFGVHVYHCHSYPVSQHVSRGLYGAYIVDPKYDTRPRADKELVMVMNGFDVNFDGENEIYAVNTRAFAYVDNPIEVKQGELVRIYLVNMLEFDLVNSFHLHANFFDEYKTGTHLKPDNFTDTIIMGQAERSLLDIRFREPGMYMFHSHATEFAELGWMGMFMVME